MIKYKRYSKDSKDYLLIKNKDSICNREVSIINEDGLPGFIPCTISKSMFLWKLQYCITDKSLTDYLNNTIISKRLFFLIFSNIINSLKNAQRTKLKFEKVIWDIDLISISQNKLDISFIYVPFTSYKSDSSLREFLLSMIHIMAFDQNEDLYFVDSLLNLLNENKIISVLLLEKYCVDYNEELIKPIYDKVGIVCPTCFTKVNSNERFCPACGRKMKVNSDMIVNNFEVNSTLVANQPTYNIEDTGVITMFYKNEKNRHMAYLQSNKGKTYVSSNPFRIGKLSENDLVLTGQSTSRKHAELISINDKYYVIDFGSTNGTFINGKRIESMKKIPLLTHTRIDFGAEKFIFNF